ncbi:hypothetical protein ANCDUO_13052 [Ancylostoma duodenale]|uniref:Prokaryotic-type class I peptide chain release factors domain-containing protein n=1 Tax=Ancylostoma duodenale TaxID=51022 RepID=A0A0C2GD04_9BILA|nr:hypothetical protein ANCDUO_13052 [Ancylostoma duodenale]
MIRCRVFRSMLVSVRCVSIKEKLKGYKFPELKPEDCEQKYISGWGPGGQKVNTAQNAVQLRHIPTGLVVKVTTVVTRLLDTGTSNGFQTHILQVHESRLLPKNIDIAFERMKHVLDRHINGDNCYEEQYKRMQREKEAKAKKKREMQRKLRKELEEDAKEPASEP